MASATRARLFVLAAAILWSTAGAAIKSVDSMTAWQIAGGRAIFAFAALAALAPEARRRPDRRTAAVALAYAATTILFVLANRLTTAANAIFLQDAAPLWVLLLSPLLLGERPTRAELRLVPVYLAGLSLFFLDRLEPGAAIGNALAVLSGFAFAFLIVGLRGLRSGGADAAVALGNLLAFAIALPGAARDFHPSTKDVAICAFLGVFQLALAYACLNRGLRGVSAVEGSLLALLEPVLNPIFAFLLAGERPGPWAIAGGAVILGATVARVRAAASPAADPARGTQ